ncbi:MAG: AAA family ATPase [Clostridiales bacterium]|jgi:chromosome partitioning protein|nr:AAA family ATPase [Clostridiales bacterium]
MTKIIAVANQKGGVGKTTTCVNLSAFLALMGKKVLAVDIDPQGNCSSGFGIDKSKLKASIYSVLAGDCAAGNAVIPTLIKNLEILPSNIDLAGAEVELVGLDERERVLKKALNPLRNVYDYILIDCPPSLGLLTVNALTAADAILIPIQGEFYALEGLSQLMNTIKLAKKHLNPALDVEGVVLTMYDQRSRLVQSVTEEIHKFFGKKVFHVRIPRNVRLGEAPSYGLPIALFEPKSTGSIAYKQLAEEFLARNNDNYTRLGDLGRLKYRGKP